MWTWLVAPRGDRVELRLQRRFDVRRDQSVDIAAERGHRRHKGGRRTRIGLILGIESQLVPGGHTADGLADRVTLGDDPADQRWRSEYLYSRAATIYGGSAEIQRNIVGEKFLGLPREPKAPTEK